MPMKVAYARRTQGVVNLLGPLSDLVEQKFAGSKTGKIRHQQKALFRTSIQVRRLQINAGFKSDSDLISINPLKASRVCLGQRHSVLAGS